jgi:hypothetical protein
VLESRRASHQALQQAAAAAEEEAAAAIETAAAAKEEVEHTLEPMHEPLPFQQQQQQQEEAEEEEGEEDQQQQVSLPQAQQQKGQQQQGQPANSEVLPSSARQLHALLSSKDHDLRRTQQQLEELQARLASRISRGSSSGRGTGAVSPTVGKAEGKSQAGTGRGPASTLPSAPQPGCADGANPAVIKRLLSLQAPAGGRSGVQQDGRALRPSASQPCRKDGSLVGARGSARLAGGGQAAGKLASLEDRYGCGGDDGPGSLGYAARRKAAVAAAGAGGRRTAAGYAMVSRTSSGSGVSKGLGQQGPQLQQPPQQQQQQQQQQQEQLPPQQQQLPPQHQHHQHWHAEMGLSSSDDEEGAGAPSASHPRSAALSAALRHTASNAGSGASGSCRRRGSAEAAGDDALAAPGTQRGGADGGSGTLAARCPSRAASIARIGGYDADALRRSLNARSMAPAADSRQPSGAGAHVPAAGRSPSTGASRLISRLPSASELGRACGGTGAPPGWPRVRTSVSFQDRAPAGQAAVRGAAMPLRTSLTAAEARALQQEKRLTLSSDSEG